MSAFSIGSETSTKSQDGNLDPAATPKSSAPAEFVKWIPGEALTFYAAVLGLGAAQGELTGNETPKELLERIDASSPAWFFLGAGIAVLLVVLGAFTVDAEKRKAGGLSPMSVAVRAALTFASFLIWSTALPGAWPSGWHLVQDMGAAYALLLLPMAAIFSSIAVLATQRLKV